MNTPEKNLLDNLSSIVGAPEDAFAKLAEESSEEATVDEAEQAETEAEDTQDSEADEEESTIEEQATEDSETEKVAEAEGYRLLFDNPDFSKGVCERITEREGELVDALAAAIPAE